MYHVFYPYLPFRYHTVLTPAKSLVTSPWIIVPLCEFDVRVMCGEYWVIVA